MEIAKLEMVNKGSLVAKFNVKMTKWGGFLIRECTLFKSGDKKWINLPSRQYEAEGKKKYYPFNGFDDRDMEDKFKAKIMEAAEEHISKLTVSEPVQSSDNGDLPF